MEPELISVLLIAFVWPEPRSSAAGVRVMNVIRALAQPPFSVTVACPATNEEARLELEKSGVRTQAISLNDSSFDEWLKNVKPEVVIFERFLMEEQFGGRVFEVCPDATRILDTIDLQSVRRLREEAHKKGLKSVEWEGDDLLRELASIYRCDHSWVVSDFERDLLTQQLGIPAELVSVSRLGEDYSPASRRRDERLHFGMIGNFRHAPNHDSVLWLRREIWPLVRARLPSAEVHVFGAYVQKEIQALHEPKSGFFVEGWAENARDALARYRVNLAPLRFGAGIKGKVIDGWASGTSCVGTAIAAEGMTEGYPFGGIVTSTLGAEEFANAMVALHEDSKEWERQSEAAGRVYAGLYGAAVIEEGVRICLLETHRNRTALRKRNRIGQMLRLSSMKSTLYFSRWLELKGRATRQP